MSLEITRIAKIKLGEFNKIIVNYLLPQSCLSRLRTTANVIIKAIHPTKTSTPITENKIG